MWEKSMYPPVSNASATYASFQEKNLYSFIASFGPSALWFSTAIIAYYHSLMPRVMVA